MAVFYHLCWFISFTCFPFCGCFRVYITHSYPRLLSGDILIHSTGTLQHTHFPPPILDVVVGHFALHGSTTHDRIIFALDSQLPFRDHLKEEVSHLFLYHFWCSLLIWIEDFYLVPFSFWLKAFFNSSCSPVCSQRILQFS